jgi:hypothetical protein
MSEEIKRVKVGDRSVAVSSYWYNRNWLVKNLFPDEAEGLDDAGLKKLGDDQGLPVRCPGSIWALNQVRKERRDVFVDMKLSFSSKMVDQVKDLADLDADSLPGAYQVAYLNGPTGSGKTMMVRIFCATVGKAYFPVLCTGDDELMLTKKLKGKKDLRASIRTEEMRKRAEYGVFETKDALLAYLRALRKNGAGDTLESHVDAFKKISQTDWDFVAESNGFPSDDSFSGIYVYGEAELAARIPMGVAVNFDEFGLATGAVQADIRELFFDRSSDLTPGVNAVFFTTDNPAGEKYFNRTPIAGDNASRLQFRTVPLPGPDELVPDVCRSFGHKVEVTEANSRLLEDSFCSTTPGLEESRPSILKDAVGMDKDVIPPSKLMGGGGKNEDPHEFFRKALGDEANTYFPDSKDDRILSKFLSREQAVNLSMRLVSFFCRIYKHVNDPTGPLNPKLYDHDSANAPEFSRRTLRSICTGVENRVRDLVEEIKDGEKVNVSEQLALCVHKSVESYILKQLDFRAAPTGTTVDGDSTRKAARESRPVISQVVRDSGLAWGDLKELFAPAQGGWVEEDLTKSFGLGKGSEDVLKNVCESAAQMGNEMKPQDSLLRIKTGDEVIYLPVGRETGGGQSGLEAKMLYRLLDPNSDGLSSAQLDGMLADYRQGGRSGENAIFDAAIRIAEMPETGTGTSALATRVPQKESGEIDLAARWGGEIAKTSGGSGIYLVGLGGGRAVAFDFDPSERRGGDKVGRVVGVSLNSAEEIVAFLSDAVVEGSSPGFSVDGTNRAHRNIHFLYPTAAPLHIKREGRGFSCARDIPEGDLTKTHEGNTPQSKTTVSVSEAGSVRLSDAGVQEDSPRGIKPPKTTKTSVRKKQVYHKRDHSV